MHARLQGNKKSRYDFYARKKKKNEAKNKMKKCYILSQYVIIFILNTTHPKTRFKKSPALK